MRDEHKTAFTRHLRRTMTDAERAIWHCLRNRTFMGYEFRRQYPIEPYIADFACPECGLVVELDSGQHDASQDVERTQHLQGQGFTVLRFWNNEILEQQHAVLAVIFDALPLRSSEQKLAELAAEAAPT